MSIANVVAIAREETVSRAYITVGLVSRTADILALSVPRAGC